ncbi:hypothetical protein [Paraburkholderia aromaticivorans]|uniref:hypothetical protein n=1 Tax=Paraburkholderia aromaticivorans TaxID=2026199 RepID=UPI001455EE21|nr:hypothetical protein [Paraburkholderia aromaticivorans]
MILSITIFAVSITLTLFQYLKQSRFGWQVAKGLSLLLFALSIWNVYEQNKDRDFYITSLEQIGTRVNWGDTDVSVELLNEAEMVPAGAVSVQMKLLAPTQLRLPPNSAIELDAIERSCIVDAQQGLGYMSAQDAEKLFHAFARPDGSIYLNTEKKAGIEHLMYLGKETVRGPLGNARVQMRLDRGPDTQSQFSSLSDLNGAIVIALIQAVSVQNPIISSVSMQLVTAAGLQRIDVPVRLLDPSNTRPITGSRYVGLCIPKEYFGVVKRQI